jgi:hypothetical protein
MSPELDLAVKVAGSCVLCWLTGYGYGSVVRHYRRIFGKASR